MYHMVNFRDFRSIEFTSKHLYYKRVAFEYKAINWISNNIDNFSKFLDGSRDLNFHLKVLGELSALTYFFKLRYGNQSDKVNAIQDFVKKK